MYVLFHELAGLLLAWRHIFGQRNPSIRRVLSPRGRAAIEIRDESLWYSGKGSVRDYSPHTGGFT